MKMLYVVNTRHDADAYRIYSKVHMDGKATKSAEITALVIGLLALGGGVMAIVKQGPRILYLATILFGLLCLFAQQIGLFRMQRQLTKNAQNMDMIIDYRFGENTFDILLYANTGKVSQPMVTETITVKEYSVAAVLFDAVLDFIKKILLFFRRVFA